MLENAFTNKPPVFFTIGIKVQSKGYVEVNESNANFIKDYNLFTFLINSFKSKEKKRIITRPDNWLIKFNYTIENCQLCSQRH